MSQSKKIDYIENHHESRITRLEVTIENINQTLLRFDKRFDKIDERFNKIDEKFSKVDERFSDFRKELLDIRKEGWSQFKWLFGLYATGALSLLAVMARGLHWL